jgi:hypothetical protein
MSGFNPERWERLWRLATNQPPPPESFAQLAARRNLQASIRRLEGQDRT